MATHSEVKAKIEAALPGALVEVEDLTGKMDHFSVKVGSSAFEGKTLVEQHQMIYQALGMGTREEIHALAIQTYKP